MSKFNGSEVSVAFCLCQYMCQTESNFREPACVLQGRGGPGSIKFFPPLGIEK